MARSLIIFRNQNFRVMWTALLITETGTAVSQIASFLLIFRLTESVFSTGLMMMATIAPSLLFGLLAGVAVDRYDRLRIMILSELGRAVLMLAVPLLLGNSINWLYVLVLASSSMGQFFGPAFYSVLPEVADDEQLGAANSLLSVSQYGAIALGSLIGGLLISRAPVAWAYYFDAVTFLISAVLLTRIHLPQRPSLIHPDESVVANVWSGLRFVAGKPTLRSLFLVFVPIGITYGFAEVLRLPFVLTVLGGSELAVGVLDSLTVVAMVVAGLLMTVYSGRRRDGQWIVLSCFGVGLASIAFAFSWSVGSAVVFGMAEGFLYAPTAIASSLIIERNTPRPLRGRVLSAFFVIRDSMFLLGMLLAGLGDLFDLRLLYALSGGVIVATGVVTLAMPGLGQSLDRWLRRRLPDRRADLVPARPLAPGEFDRWMAVAPILTTFDDPIRDRLAVESRLVVAPLGSTIIAQDATSDAAYFVLDGTVTAMRHLPGGSEVLEVLVAGDFFGEIAALTGARRTADVIATDQVIVIKLPSDLWRDLALLPGYGELIHETVDVRLTRLGGCDAALPGRIDYQGLAALRGDGAD